MKTAATAPKLQGLHPFAGQDLNVLLSNRAKASPDALFMVWEPAEFAQASWTYKAFQEDVARTAAAFASNGIAAGDYLIIHLENCPEFLICWFACARIGAVAVTTNTRLSGEELTYLVSDCGAKGAVTQPKYVDAFAQCRSDLDFLVVTQDDAGQAAEAPANVGSLKALIEAAADHPAPDPVAADPWRPLSVMYTSGTTSRPKGVLWTHGNALWGGKLGAMIQNMQPDDVQLVFLPLFHCNAFVCQMLSSLSAGASIVLMSRFSASRFWSVSTSTKCTITSLVPFCVRAIADQPVPDHSYRLFIGGANNIYDAKYNVRTLGWWGMTETVIPGITGSLAFTDEAGTIGRPSPYVEIAITNPDGELVKAGEIGDLRIKGIPGLSIFHSYLNMPDYTSECFDENGFFLTGDRCKLNENGTISFCDRAKDMLKVGGENVAASEIERVVVAVSGVKEVAVVGKRHPMLDEVPVAFIILEDGAEQAATIADVNGSCEQKLADFKRPRDVLVVEDLPRSTLQKVAKNVLRDMLRESEVA